MRLNVISGATTSLKRERKSFSMYCFQLTSFPLLPVSFAVCPCSSFSILAIKLHIPVEFDSIL